MLIRGVRTRLPLPSCSRCAMLAVVGVAFVVLTSAAPVVRDHVIAEEASAAVAKQDSEKPLVRAKRADEIIFDNVQNVGADGTTSSNSPAVNSDKQTDSKPNDVTKPTGKQPDSPPAVNEIKPEIAKNDESTGNDGSSTAADDISEPNEDDQQQSADSSSSSVTWDSDADDDKRRRRRSAKSDTKDGADAAADRTKREASAAMVAENMAVAGTGNSRLQRAKRDLDADEIREIIESRQPLAEDYEGSDYGPSSDYNDALVPPSDEQEEDEADDEGDGQEDSDDDDAEQDARKYIGRPKRRIALTDEEREEVLEEAERQVVRELLAERAAEETRQALLNYLSGYEEQQAQHRIAERYDEQFRNEGNSDDETYEEDDEDNGGEEDEAEAEDEEGNYEEPVEGQEELIEDGDGRFLVDQQEDDGGDEEQTDDESSVAGQKRFSFPYSYEPYGGRWGAMVPGSKRDDGHDPYDRLYQLAEALSRPSTIGGGDSSAEDEKKKK